MRAESRMAARVRPRTRRLFSECRLLTAAVARPAAADPVLARALWNLRRRLIAECYARGIDPAAVIGSPPRRTCRTSGPPPRRLPPRVDA